MTTKVKTKAELLAAYKKANKLRKQVIVANSGWLTEYRYLEFLNGKAAPKGVAPKAKAKTTKKVPTIHNVHILDCSASMSTSNRIGAAVQGINEDLAGLKTIKGANYTHSFIDFSEDFIEHNFMTPLANIGVIPLMKVRQNTALYQCVGETLNKLRNNLPKGDKVLVKIFTDGEENASKGTYNPRSEGGTERLKALIAQCENEGFTITFVGTDHDIRTVVNSLGIHASNTLAHDNSFGGIADAFAATRGATVVYTKSVLDGKDVKKGFYKKKGTL